MPRTSRCKQKLKEGIGAEGGTHTPCCFTPLFRSFLIFLSILTLRVIALFTPFVLTGLFCDSDVTPKFPT